MLKNAQKRCTARLKTTTTLAKSRFGQKNSKKFSVNLNIPRIQKHKEITEEALRESIVGETNPMKNSIYSEEYFKILEKERSGYAQPVTTSNAEDLSHIANGLVWRRPFYETTSFFEETQGINGETISNLTGHPFLLHPEEIRFDDAQGDYHLAQREKDPLERAYNLRQIDYIRGETEGLFDNVYDPQDHFEKYLGGFDELESNLVGNLDNNQILIANLPPGVNSSSIRKRLENISYKPICIRETKNNLGNIVNIVLTLDPKAKKGIISYLGSMVFYKNTIIALTKDTPVEQESLENRTIVIENIPKDQDIHRYIETMAQVPGFVTAEAAFEYKNPILSSTEEVKKSIEENMSNLKEEEGYQAFILEKDGDRINQIKLDNDFDVSDLTVVKGTEFSRESVVKERYDYNIKAEEEQDNASFLNQFMPNKTGIDNPKISSREYDIIEKVFFESSKTSQEQYEDLSKEELEELQKNNDPESPYYNRLGGVTNQMKKKKMINRHELAAEGEKHLGYFFVTYGTSFEAKKAMYIATQKFDFLNEDLDKLSNIKANLKNDTCHMDYDQDFKLKTYKAMKIRSIMNDKEFQEKLEEAKTNRIIQETKKNLIQSISSAANPGAPIPAEEGFYSAISGMNRVHDNIQNSSDFKANISKLSRSNTGASNYSEKLRNKFEIKKRLKRIFELEAKKKYMNSSSYFKLNVAGDDERFERNLVGRKFKKMDGDEVFEFSLEFLKRNLKYKRAKKIGMSGLRVDPELSQLIDSLDEFDQTEVNDYLRQFVEDYTEENTKEKAIERLSEYNQNVRNRLSLADTSIDGDAYLDLKLREITNEQGKDRIKNLNKFLVTKMEDSKKNPVSGNGEPLKKKFTVKQRRHFSTTPINNRNDEYLIKKNRFVTKINNIAQENFESLGMFDEARDYARTILNQEYEMKDFNHIRNVNRETIYTQEEIDQIKNEVHSIVDYPNDIVENVLILRLDNETHRYRDGGKLEAQERKESRYLKLIKNEIGRVQGFYDEASEEGQGETMVPRTLEETAEVLNRDSVYHRYTAYDESKKGLESGKRLVKVILPERCVNAERLLKFLKERVIPIYKAKLSEDSSVTSIQAEQKISSLDTRSLLRVTKQLLSDELFGEDIYDAMLDSLSSSEIDIIFNLQVKDENKIIRDIENWRQIEMAREIVKPISQEDLIRYHRKNLKNAGSDNKLTKEDLYTLF